MGTILLKGLAREFLIACVIMSLCAITECADFCILLWLAYFGYGIVEVIIACNKKIKTDTLNKVFGGLTLLGTPVLFGFGIFMMVLAFNLVHFSH